MRRTQARHVSAGIQRRTVSPAAASRQRGPPARTFCDLTKHPLHDAQVPARTGGLSAAYQPDREGFIASKFLGGAEHATSHTLPRHTANDAGRALTHASRTVFAAGQSRSAGNCGASNHH